HHWWRSPRAFFLRKIRIRARLSVAPRTGRAGLEAASEPLFFVSEPASAGDICRARTFLRHALVSPQDVNRTPSDLLLRKLELRAQRVGQPVGEVHHANQN